MRALALLVIAGCGRIGFDAQGGSTDGGPPCFEDRFDALDTAFWRETDPSTSIDIAVANGRLAMTPAPMIDEYNSLAARSLTNLTDAAFEVEVAQTTNPPRTETAIEIEYTVQTRFVISTDGSVLLFLETNGQTPANRPFDPIADRFWRVRHEAASAQIRFQTSRDGMQWGGDYVIPTMQTGGVTFYFYVGQFGGGNATPGTALFDNFRIVRDSCS